MKVGNEYEFLVKTYIKTKNVTTIEDEHGKEYIVQGDYSNHTKVFFIVTALKAGKYFFSQQNTDDKKIELDKYYKMQVINSNLLLSENNIVLRYSDKDYICKVLNGSSLLQLNHGDYVNCNIKSIIKETLNCNVFGYLNKGEKYEIILDTQLANGFWKARTVNGIYVQVLRPYVSSDKEIAIGGVFKYTYEGVDKKGHHSFKQKILFEDVIDSRALKVIAFDNLRKEYSGNSTFYSKLFSDYDEQSNLWLLTYGNALIEVIDDKIQLKEWDIAFLLLEVLEKIEKWIINFGFLYSFQHEKRSEILTNAKYKLYQVKIKSNAITSILHGDISSLNEKISQALKAKEFNTTEINDLIDTLNEIYKFDDALFDNSFISILQLFKDSKNKIVIGESKIHLYVLINIVNQILSKNHVFNEVFINPFKRNKYFSNNIDVKKLILYTVWLACFCQNDLEDYIYKLRILRYLSYYLNDSIKQETIIVLALKSVYDDRNEINLPLDKFDLLSSNIESLAENLVLPNNFKLKINEETSVQVPERVIINNCNYFGFLSVGKPKVIIPYKENNIDTKLNEDISIEFRTVDPITSMYIGSKVVHKINQDLTKIRVGAAVKGIVKGINEHGLFMNLGEVDGFIHVSKLSHNTTDAKKIFSVGEEMTVRIDSIIDDKVNLERLSLIKESAEKNKLILNQVVEGKIFRIDNNYGIYLELENGGKGYLPKDYFYNNDSYTQISEYFHIGETIRGIVKKNNDKGCTIALNKEMEFPKLFRELLIGSEHPARIVKIETLDEQIKKVFELYNKNIAYSDMCDRQGNYLCPNCQSEANTDKYRTNLEVSEHNKSWYCLYCLYKSNERVVLRFIDFPFLCFASYDEFFTKSLSDFIGHDVNVKVIEKTVNKDIYVTLSKSNDILLTKNQLINNSKRISTELGYLYEQYSVLSEDLKEEYITLCQLFFGIAKSARSYFYSFLYDYFKFVDTLDGFTLQNASELATKATMLINKFKSEKETIETFPILNHIILSLEILSKIEMGDIEKVTDFLKNILDKDIDAELFPLVKLIASFSLVSENDIHIKEEIWSALILSIKKNVRLIQDDMLDNDMIELKKRIKTIIKNNKEDDLIECKGSFEVPLLSKGELKEIADLNLKLNEIDFDEDTKKSIKNKIGILTKPKPYSKEFTSIVILGWVKSIAALANTHGGELVIGIGEDKDGDFDLLGVEKDLIHCKTEDGLILKFDTYFNTYIGDIFQHLVKLDFVKIYDNKTVIYIRVSKSNKPVFVKDDKQEKFYIRRKASTVQLGMRNFSEYSATRFNNVD